ncbi:MAG: peptide chain release factor N(5)-glutamine methyltransferase [Clostridia bacterium]|jgi:release factor glutamine methyltransferase|nr:peptide chain release factor N(5)-glutamine methyltransferase [Clostridia bacterium]
MKLNSQDRPQTGAEALRWAVSFLEERGFAPQAAWQEARLLLAKAWQKNTLQILIEPEANLDCPTWEKYASFIKKRGDCIPLHYLLEEKEFMSLPFKVSPSVLIPRWDTEVLVEEALKLLRNQENPRILDLGTGSGIIAISLAYYLPQAVVVATDLCPQALEIARENAFKLGVAARIKFLEGHLFTPLHQDEQFDVIASNPPYLSAEEMKDLPSDVRNEPLVALAGGKDGLAYYRAMAPEVKKYLAPEGHFLVEIGWQQALSVVGILQEQGLAPLRILCDLEGRDRVVVY